jgi:hypothetical protein
VRAGLAATAFRSRRRRRRKPNAYNALQTQEIQYAKWKAPEIPVQIGSFKGFGCGLEHGYHPHNSAADRKAVGGVTQRGRAGVERNAVPSGSHFHKRKHSGRDQ